MIKYKVLDRFTGEVKFTASINCKKDDNNSWKLRLAVLWAVENKKDLSSADLSSANLRSANLRSANLSSANLSSANLSYADLSSADLSSADLSYADLSYADLSSADLSSADLSSANLSSADLSSANLRIFKHDLWGILVRYRAEVPALLQALKDGKINGSVYSGKCACLMGTIANIKGCPVEDKSIVRDAGSPAETWFLQISEGQTPENHGPAKITAEWIEEFLQLQAA